MTEAPTGGKGVSPPTAETPSVIPAVGFRVTYIPEKGRGWSDGPKPPRSRTEPAILAETGRWRDLANALKGRRG